LIHSLQHAWRARSICERDVALAVIDEADADVGIAISSCATAIVAPYSAALLTGRLRHHPQIAQSGAAFVTCVALRVNPITTGKNERNQLLQGQQVHQVQFAPVTADARVDT